MPAMPATPRPTRYMELKYLCEARGSWRFIDTTTGAIVGPPYKSRVELMADMDRFARTFGADGPTSSRRNRVAVEPAPLTVAELIDLLTAAVDNGEITRDSRIEVSLPGENGSRIPRDVPLRAYADEDAIITVVRLGTSCGFILGRQIGR